MDLSGRKAILATPDFEQQDADVTHIVLHLPPH